MRENYVNIGRRRQARRAVTGRVVTVIICAVIIFAASVLLGNYLRERIEALPPRGEMPDTLLQGQLPADTSDASAISIMASHLPLVDTIDTASAAAIAEDLALGSREAVSLCLRDSAGEVHFRSTVAQGLTGQAGAGLELGVLISALRSAGIYTSAVVTVTSFAEPEPVAHDLQRAFEISLAAEIAAAGVDELMLVGLPVSVDTLDDVSAYVDEVARQLPEQVQLAVAMPMSLLDGASGTVLSGRLAQYADSLALDLRSLEAAEGKSFVDTVADVLGAATLYFSKYNMRVLLPDTDDATFSTLRQVLEVNAVRNWQVIGEGKAPAPVVEPAADPVANPQ